MKAGFAATAAVALACYSVSAHAQGQVHQLPPSLIFLRDVEPSIIQDIRYAGQNNFAGHPLAGYDSKECVLTERTAHALKNAQEHIGPRYSLKVFDCYRPKMAVIDLLKWSLDGHQDKERKAAYHPDFDKRELFERGFIARRSHHSRGVAVDVTLVDISHPLAYATSQNAPAPCSRVAAERASDSNLDFGTGFDCLDDRSSTGSRSISAEARKNRKLLLEVMKKSGFSNYNKEWWHFEFDDPLNSPEYNVRIPPRSPEAEVIGAPKQLKSMDNSCGTSRPLRIACSSSQTYLPIYEGPSQTSKQIRELSIDGLVNCLRCTGRTPLTEYVKLDAISKSIGDPPWCEIRTPDQRSGWIDGRYLAPVNEVVRDCPALKPPN
jgi:D-alanyl-D-alanine dipeptidase